ncbi:glycerophosphodiester phosphodiesterase [Roseomonas eburnea]|uniref:Glycerophosphodiester phosphodiesterase n=1 Tax=Neoroseomonas eburnea TaxID=1346889 RepID=A0A9X9XGJ6_9PROT|nr:glycerophosphodiester phosphodiesterase family protein [Neoroseomonas eburnea]MBR0682832.1 glycerophosphodiester phosphodiesterase [Neoroseomonas eburnea]
MSEYRTAIASHRGGAFLWPENSLSAFRQTAMLPVEQAECDVHPSADGDPVILHDATLERTTDGRGPVAGLSTAEVRRHRIRGGGGEGVPLLADMLALLQGTSIDPRIEVKADLLGRAYPGFLPRVLDVLDRQGARGRSWIIAFDAPTAAEAAAAGGLAGVAWLLEATTWRSLGMRGTIAVAHGYGFPEIGVHESLLDAEACAALRMAGLRISVWGANHEASIRRMLGLGIDVLTTDDPPLAVALRSRGGR